MKAAQSRRNMKTLLERLTEGGTLENIKIVELHFDNYQQMRTYFVPADEVDRFVEAHKELHVSPGVNPYNGVTTNKIRMIMVSDAGLVGPYWWTTPGLKETKPPEPPGARYYAPMKTRQVYIDPDWAAEME